jgi:integrase
MASIRKRGTGHYQVRIRRNGYPDITKSFATLGDARAWTSVTESEITRGSFISRSDFEHTTLHEALGRYSREVTPMKKGASQEQCRIKVWQQHPLAQRFLASLRGTDMAWYRDSRLNDSKSGNTVRIELALISHLFEIARKEWGMEYLVNPVKAIRMPKVARGRDRRMSADEERRLLDYCKANSKHRLGAAIKLAVETGMRRSELVRLQWQDIDWGSKVARLADTKNGESRDVPLSSAAIEVLSNLPHNIDGRVFGCHPDVITWQFAEVCKAIGIAGLRFHDVRHEATSRLFEKKFNMMEVAAITGHKTLHMLKRYTHLKAADLAARLG